MRLDELVGSLRAVDARLQGLEAERTKFELIETACRALSRLDELGGGALFWQGRDGATLGGPDHLALVRSRFAEFEKQIALVEESRQALLDEIANVEQTADVFAGHILDVERIEEEKETEWLIEREVDRLPIRPTLMPWVRGQEDDRRFRRTLLLALLVSIAIGVVFPMVDIPLPEHWEIMEEQERLTQLIREELPKPPVAVVKEEPKPVAPVDPEEPALETDGEAAPELADTAQRESNAAPAAQPNTGGRAGSGSGSRSRGILAFREKFAGVTATNDAVDRLGANAQIHDPNAVADGLPERSMVTSNAPGSSGGINVAALSRGTGGTGTALSGVAVTRATSTLGTGSGNGNGSGNGTGNGSGNGTGSGNGRGGARSVSGGGANLGRTDEEIQIVFDRHKAALYRLYNRELRQNPTLKGQMVLRLTIQPDGTVSFCEVKSTDMKSPQLAQQVVERVKGFDFGPKAGIPAVTIVYPIDFLPAT
ncbi:MAG: AgmX/PglI C-terminal domain-containing protein [Myxococcota bacterium]